SLRVEAMQERCGAASWPAARISSTVSSVPSRVEPPAPKVQEKNRGLSAASSCQVARSFAFPSGVFGGKNSKLLSIDVGLERRVARAVDRRVQARLRAHPGHGAAKPRRLEPAAVLEVVRKRGFHPGVQTVGELHARLDEVVGERHAARAAQAPGLAHRLLEEPPQLDGPSYHAEPR